jgi:4'-phosphopantetheinyl transferase
MELITPHWLPCTAAARPPVDTVHVWRVAADQPAERWHGLLTPHEAGRLGRFRAEADARREATGRGALRLLLGHYLGQTPTEIAIGAGPFGKPQLAPGSGEAPLRFNLSHSGEWVLLAFATRGEIGVDLERHREMDLADVARFSFTAEELAEWHALPATERTRAFFDRWTAKEAYLKALGCGIGKDPRSVRIARSTTPAPEIVSCADVPDASIRWQLRRLAPAPGYSAALAADADISRVRLFTLPPPASFP